MENNPPKKLDRSRKNEMLGGVCGGIAEYFNLDPTLVRLAFVLFCALAGGGLIAYIVALIIIPKAPDTDEKTEAKAETHASPTPEDPSSEDNDSPTML